ncbi:MAG: hypothetical protein K8Q89_05450 [Nitrosarchaeum sp.]|nr:hypothetical protein [Nitrosarchaeum sp.]
MAYELFPYLIFDEQNFLFSVIVPSVGLIFGLYWKKIPLKIFSSKNKSTKANNPIKEKPVEDSIESMVNSYAEDDKMVVSDGTIGNSEIEAMLARTNTAPSAQETPDIESLLAGTDSNTFDVSSNDQNLDAQMMIMEKIEPIENAISTFKLDFDQFKQDLIMVKEEVDALSSSFESTMTEIKCITTDFNNPLNFMNHDSIRQNIQTIDVDKLIKPTISTSISENIREPEPVREQIREPEPVREEIEESTKDIAHLPEEIKAVVEEFSNDFSPEEVYELAKIHCKTSKIALDEKQLALFIDKKNNSDELKKKFNISESAQSKLSVSSDVI